MSLLGQRLPVELAMQAERIVAALMDEATRFTVTSPQIRLDELTVNRVTDPGNQLPGYEGIWRNAADERCGCLTFNSDGSFYAEYDLFCPHPTDTRWYVQMVTAWGREDSLRVEVQIIPGFNDT
jgi:hypothetical protein